MGRKGLNLTTFPFLRVQLFYASRETQQAAAHLSWVSLSSASQLCLRSQIFAQGWASASLVVAVGGGKVQAAAEISLNAGVPTRGSLSKWAGKLWPALAFSEVDSLEHLPHGLRHRAQKSEQRRLFPHLKPISF